MRVLFVSAEVAPFAKVGGLADVALALPGALAELGVEVAVVMPEYRGVREKTELVETVRFSVPVGKGDKECVAMQGALPESEVPIYFLRNGLYFDRPQIYGDAGATTLIRWSGSPSSRVGLLPCVRHSIGPRISST